MNRIITIYGLLSGLIVTCSLVLTCIMMSNGAPEGAMMAVGFGFMLLAFALMFVAVHRYRSTLPDQRISFLNALKIAGGIALISSLFYAGTWLIIYYNFYPNFLDDYYNRNLEGKSAAEILELQKEKANLKVWYAHWYGILATALYEILPIGLLFALICSFIYSRKRESRR